VRTGRFGFASAQAYGSEVVACSDGFVPGTKVPGFYLEELCASFWFGILLGFKVNAVPPFYSYFSDFVRISARCVVIAFRQSCTSGVHSESCPRALALAATYASLCSSQQKYSIMELLNIKPPPKNSEYTGSQATFGELSMRFGFLPRR